ncbi:MAG: protein-export chaperone SecB [Saprospiraceae bacterium]
MEKYQLELLSFEIRKVLFERSTMEKSFNFETNVKFGIKNISKTETNEVFSTAFIVELKNSTIPQSPSIQVEAVGFFEIHGNPPKEVIENYKNISSPTIVYPYIRAFISNLTTSSGLNSVILPTIAFAG